MSIGENSTMCFETFQQREHDVVSRQYRVTVLGDCNLESWTLLEEKNHIHATEQGSQVQVVIAIMEKNQQDPAEHHGINSTINNDKN